MPCQIMFSKWQLYYYSPVLSVTFILLQRLSFKITVLGVSLQMKGAPGSRDSGQDGLELLLAGNSMRFIFAHWLVSEFNWKIQLKCHRFWIFHSLQKKNPTDDHVTSILGHKTFQNLNVQRVKSSLWWLKLGDTDFVVLPVFSQRKHSVNMCWMNGWMNPQVTSLCLCLKQLEELMLGRALAFSPN